MNRDHRFCTRCGFHCPAHLLVVGRSYRFEVRIEVLGRELRPVRQQLRAVALEAYPPRRLLRPGVPDEHPLPGVLELEVGLPVPDDEAWPAPTYRGFEVPDGGCSVLGAAARRRQTAAVVAQHQAARGKQRACGPSKSRLARE
eukprot:CAMPEP_0179147740 /NCGR_PEP_ID=MMETSP0796-20121207/71439_1 /TAXON_ID=73915 /ORGANISM="Pyrodinium bahamense, Strain pbaha01" /LENGTH=142 /DNA_ID=CAMNT_0020848367 /DNA_START=959 /DNA_END=1384 /DNA_ORIENTATION=+